MTVRAFGPYGFGMLAIGFTWLALLYLGILLCALLYRDTWIGICLRWRPLRWLGGIAYGVYLFHGLLLGVVWGLVFGREPEIRTMPELLVTVGTLIATLFLCRLSWNYFEKPLVQMGHRIAYQVAPVLSPALTPPHSAKQANLTQI